MSPLPKTKRAQRPDTSRAKLEAWLDEWHADRILDRVSVPRDVGFEIDAPINQPEDDPRPTYGDIRLLAPDAPAAGSRPVLLALLEPATESQWLVAPFSRFATPATPGELQTGLEDAGLAVLCVWNTARLPDSVLQQSWRVDAIGDELLADIQSLSRHLEHETQVQARLLDRIGPPLQHPADPRHTYVSEEMARMEQLQNPDTAAPLIYPARADDEIDLPLAADTRRSYGIPSRYSLEGTALVLRLVIDRSGERCVIFVEDIEDRASRELDGASITAGKDSAIIEDGSALFPLGSIDDDLAVTRPDGTRIIAVPDPS